MSGRAKGLWFLLLPGRFLRIRAAAFLCCVGLICGLEWSRSGGNGLWKRFLGFVAFVGGCLWLVGFAGRELDRFEKFRFGILWVGSWTCFRVRGAEGGGGGALGSV